MKPDYKNWVPTGLIRASVILAVLMVVGLVVICAGGVVGGIPQVVLGVICAVGVVACGCMAVWSVIAYRAFSYDGERQLSRTIVEGIAAYVTIPQGGCGLDVGCGSGALAIACAKRNPHASMVGIDRWGKDYASFSLPLCERNARAEGESNVRFVRGDATRLDFPDETFDVVTSNYVYHNIVGANKQELLLETLRVLKKGGTFAIHDLMSRSRYGDMEAFAKRLRQMGYKRVDFIDTTKGLFMTPGEARVLMLGGSTLIVGMK